VILYSEGATQAQEDEAEDIVAVLTIAYPGHPWAVRVYDGGFFIRHLAFPTNWGMNCKYKDTGHDWAVMRREIIMKAGEWLERAGMRRGRYDADQEIGRVEGVPEKKIEGEFALDWSHDKDPLGGNEGQTIREIPRPQVEKMH
jgi:hypothetical protein